MQRKTKSGTTRSGSQKVDLNKKKKNEVGIAQKGVRRQSAPKIQNQRDGCLITHSEFYGTVNSGVIVDDVATYWSESQDLNPANANLFPWLQAIALRYEQFEFKSLSFEYRPTCATTTPGAFAMGVDWDAHDTHDASLMSEFEYRMMIMAHPGAVQSNIWDGCRLTAPPGALAKLRYVNDNRSHTEQDRWCALGRVYMGQFGYATTTNSSLWLGDLTVHYTVLLRYPQLPNSPGEEESKTLKVSGFNVTNENDSRTWINPSNIPSLTSPQTAPDPLRMAVYEEPDSPIVAVALPSTSSSTRSEIQSQFATLFKKGRITMTDDSPAFGFTEDFNGVITVRVTGEYYDDTNIILNDLEKTSLINNCLYEPQIYRIADGALIDRKQDYLLHSGETVLDSYSCGTLDLTSSEYSAKWSKTFRLVGSFLAGTAFKLLAVSAPEIASFISTVELVCTVLDSIVSYSARLNKPRKIGLKLLEMAPKRTTGTQKPGLGFSPARLIAR